MPNAIRIHEPGGPEVMRWEAIEIGDPGSGQVRLRQHAAGLNFIDVYHRTGLYPQPLPFTPGSEAAGVVEEVGAGVTTVRPGDRVAYAMVIGAYAEYAVVPAEKLVPLPDGVDARTAAAAMLQGMTAHYLVAGTYDLRAGQTALVHAAAGGVGGLLVQMCVL